MNITFDGFYVELIDDGTLDTVLRVNCKHTVRFDAEYASQYRSKSGGMTKEGFKQLANEAVEDYLQVFEAI